MEVNIVGVIGAGIMGSGIAQICAVSGRRVVLVDTTEAAVERGMAGISGTLDRAVNKGMLDAAGKAAALDRIAGTTDYERLAQCDLVIEAATENEEIKMRVLKRVDEVVRPDAIIATNTSSISITRLAAATSRPERV